MMTGGVRFKDIEEMLCASPNNPVEQAFAGDKANDAAFVETDSDVIVIVKGDRDKRRKKRKKVTEEVREALNILFQ